MASTTSLGKRTRSSRDSEALDLPAKRTRRSTRVSADNDENRDPATAIAVDSVDDQENVSPTEESPSVLQDTPPKRRSRNASIVETKKSASYFPVTPQTPRHYDVFAKGNSTPRHRVMSVGKLSTRLTPQTPVTPTSCQTVYHQARQLFSRSADPGQLIGRDDERSSLRAFLERCTGSNPGGCIYVSGPPGTGKSAMVNQITQEVVAGTAIRQAYINCMSIKSSKDLYATLLDQLSDGSDMSEDDASATLRALFTPKKKGGDVFVVVLDEIDHILTLDPESLYRVFEWSLQKGSRLALVGIANALDLTDRFLPRLKSRNLKPELLPVLPYSAAQIKTIITTRLKKLLPEGTATPEYLPFFHPAAIELCSRKVASQTGDLRKAFEICRRAIDLVESEVRLKHENEVKEQLLQMSPSRKVLGENANLASKSTSLPSMTTSVIRSLQALTVETAPRVSIGHLNKVTAAAFSHGTSQRLKTLNLQQKAAVCALMALEKRNKAALRTSTSAGPQTPSKLQVTAPTIKALFDTYSVLCTRDSVLHPLSSSEFREVIGSLETLSLITAVDGKTGSLSALQTPSKRGRKPAFAGAPGLADEKRVASCVGDREIEQAIEGLGADILRSILSGEALD